MPNSARSAVLLVSPCPSLFPWISRLDWAPVRTFPVVRFQPSDDSVPVCVLPAVSLFPWSGPRVVHASGLGLVSIVVVPSWVLEAARSSVPWSSWGVAWISNLGLRPKGLVPAAVPGVVGNSLPVSFGSTMPLISRSGSRAACVSNLGLGPVGVVSLSVGGSLPITAESSVPPTFRFKSNIARVH